MEISARHMFCWSAGFVDHYIKFYFQIHLCSVIQLGFKATLTLFNYIINDSNNQCICTDYDQVRYFKCS